MGTRARPVLVLLLYASACGRAAREPACTLEAWQDGDTARVVCDEHADVVRLVGIDTPESGFDEHSSRRAQWQAELWGMSVDAVVRCGKAATERASELCVPGTAIDLVGDERDRYDRRLATIHCGGRDVNRTLVDEGLAGNYPFPDDPERPARCP